jgi:hypothetical protein
MTEWLLWLSAVMRRYGIVLIALFVIAVIFLKRELETERGETLAGSGQVADADAGPGLHQLGRRPVLPRAGDAAAQRRADPEIAGDQPQATGNRILSEAIAKASENISSGQSLAGPLARASIFRARSSR